MVKRRRYESPARRAAAEETRRAVLTAARDLFAARGWAGTSVAEFARGAGVPVDTVCASVGRKPELLLAVHDDELAEGAGPVPAVERDYVAAVRAAPTARRKIEVYADALGRLLPRTVPLLLALREAGRSDPACRDLYAAVSARRAANLVWSMNGPEYFELVASRCLEPSAYAALLVRVWTATLLRS